MAGNQKSYYKRYPNEYSNDYRTFIDGNTVRKQDIQEDTEPKRNRDQNRDQRQIQRQRERQKEKIIRQKQELKAIERARVFDFSFAFFVMVVVILMVFCGIIAITPLSESRKLKLEIKSLTADLLDTKKINDEFETDLNNRLDLDYVRQVAKSAGLSYPKSGQKIYVDTIDSDYCVQLVPIE